MQFSVLAGLLAICNCIVAVAIDSSQWENSHYLRTVDLSRSYVRETALLQITNTGKKPQNEYFFTINDGFGAISDISFFSATLSDQRIELAVKLVEADGINSAATYRIEFPAPIAPKSLSELLISYVYVDGLTPFPAKLEMEEVQSLLIKVNKFPYSPYTTKEYSLHFTGIAKGQEMELFLDTEVEVSTDVPNLRPRVENKALVYGPTVDELAPYVIVPMGLHYEHNRPLTRAENYNRSVWIPASNVDQLPIEEYYELTNNAAELASGFSRVEWMRGRYDVTRNHWALSHIEIPLTKETTFDDYYYSDLVGVVSSHDIVKNHLLLQPRFPVFGNWHYNFTLGWNNRLADHLHKVHDQEDTFIVKVPLVNGARDVTYANTYLSFYLPEDSEFINLSSPIPYESLTVDNDKSYLDVSGGHVKITVHYKNLFTELSKLDVFVVYKYSPVSYLWKIAKISGFVFVGLISYYLLGLVDISIDKKKAEEKK